MWESVMRSRLAESRRRDSFLRNSDTHLPPARLMPSHTLLRPTPVGDTGAFEPDRHRPVRVRARPLSADSHFEPHSHPWSQLAYCATGVVQVTTLREGAGGKEVTYIVPPSRAVWIAPGAPHAVHVLEDASFRTLYVDASATPAGWERSRVIVVSSLLREAVQALDGAQGEPVRERLLTALVLDELARADTQARGVPLPSTHGGDKRLRILCEALLRSPAQCDTLAGWSAGVGASERTMARLFRDQLGTSFQRWRQQAILAHALPMLARGLPVSHVAALSGYASDSAFSAMFKSAMGQPPSRFRGSAAT
jgi:AraC-like DNA-binding protein